MVLCHIMGGGRTYVVATSLMKSRARAISSSPIQGPNRYMSARRSLYHSGPSVCMKILGMAVSCVAACLATSMSVVRVKGSRLSGWSCVTVELSAWSRLEAGSAVWGSGVASGMVGMGWWLLALSAGGSMLHRLPRRELHCWVPGVPSGAVWVSVGGGSCWPGLTLMSCLPMDRLQGRSPFPQGGHLAWGSSRRWRAQIGGGGS